MAPAGLVGAPPGPWWGQDVASLAVFDAALAPYGIWGTHSRFGRVFLPSGIGADWQPYVRGQWVRDPRLGPVFAGADPFGWTTFNYGRWGRDDRFGWFWIPDTRFAPPVGIAGVAGAWQGGQAAWNRGNGGWGSQWGGGWGPQWGAGWGGGHPGWHPGWNGGWNGGWGGGWNRWNNGWGGGWNNGWGGWGGGWGPGWHGGWNDRRWRDRPRDRHRDRDPDWVDRTRPGESPMAGFVRNRVTPPDYQPPAASVSAPVAPPSGWRTPRSARGDGLIRTPRGDAMGGFVRSRVQQGDASGRQRSASAMIAPARALPAEPGAASARVTVSTPPPRAERPQPSYARMARSGEGSRPRMRGPSARYADD